MEVHANQLGKGVDFSVQAKRSGQIVCGKYYQERKKISTKEGTKYSENSVLKNLVQILSKVLNKYVNIVKKLQKSNDL